MSAMSSLPAENLAGLYLLNVALIVTVLAGLGLLAVGMMDRRAAPLRHAILLATLLLLLLSPLALAASWHWDLGMLALPGAFSNGAYELPAAAGAGASSDGHLSQSWRWVGPILITTWLMGMAWRIVVLQRGLRLVQRLRRSLRPLTNTRWVRLAEKASWALELRWRADIAVSDLLTSPVSLGIFLPIIVVPASLEGALEEAEIEGILLHEAAHIARKDHLAGFLEQMARIVFWWNPLIRQLCGALDDAQEELCDNHVVLNQGSGLHFAGCLVKVAERALRCKALPTIAGLLGRRSLEYRLTNLLRTEQRAATWLTPGMSILLALFVIAAGTMIVAGAVRPVSPSVQAFSEPTLANEIGARPLWTIHATPGVLVSPLSRQMNEKTSPMHLTMPAVPAAPGRPAALMRLNTPAIRKVPARPAVSPDSNV